MTSKLVLLALFSLLINFSACNKNDEVDEYQPIIPVPKIKTMSYNRFANDVVTFEYDETGRITKKNWQDKPYEEYNYVSDTLIVLTNTSQFQKITVDSLILNEKGYLKTLIKMTSASGENGEIIHGSYKINYEYNTEGYNNKLYTYEDISIKELINGNTVKSTKEDVNVFTYEFFTTTANTIGYENMGMPWMGKQNKNLMSKMNDYWFYNGNSKDYVYSYQYDHLKRVVKETVSTSSYSTSTSYTYY